MIQNYYFASLIFFSGVCFFSAVTHFSSQQNAKQRSVNLLFGATSLLVVLGTLSAVMCYNTADQVYHIAWARINMSFTILGVALLPWFFALYSRVSAKPVLIGSSALSLLLFFINLIHPNTFLYSEIHEIELLLLPWGEEVFLPIATPSIWGIIGAVYILFIPFFGMYVLWKRFRLHRRRSTLIMMFGVGFLMIAMIQAILARLLSIHDIPPLGTYGYLSLVIVMGISLTSELRENRKQAEMDLRKKNDEYEILNQELIKTNKELFNAKEKAVESDRLKTAFLQNMSHEIRTPMNAIMGFSSLLPSYFDEKDQLEEFSKIINQRGSDLLDIINDILDISKIESDQNSLNIEECNIHTLFSELRLFFRDYQIRTNKLEIELILLPCNDDSCVIVKTDKVKLKQILVNLISNAFKFTVKGSITCSVEKENNKLRFCIRDTGVGIPENKFDYIFERFAQLTNSSIRNTGGTGLGLSIVKGLVGLLGGEIWLESECDKGTTFFFTIDYIPCEITKTVAVTSTNSNENVSIQKTILIVEDDPYNAIYLNEILKKHVTNIFTVTNGTDAIEFAKNNKVDIILMDVNLPDISGYEATKEILQHNTHLIIIAQTAYAAEDERAKALANGCIDYISKPTKQVELLNLLRKHSK